MICSNCSVEMPDISVFCPGCGQPVSSAADAWKPTESAPVGSGDRLLGGLAYMALLPAVIFLLIPSVKANRFVRFHSWQSVLFVAASLLIGGAARLLFSIFSVIPAIGFLLGALLLGVVALALLITWFVLVLKALQGRSYELPLAGNLAVALTG